MVVQIAICDDEQIYLEVLVQQISTQFTIIDTVCKIHPYVNGEKLLSESGNIIFDIVFLDIEMPLLNGIEIAEKIRERNPYVHIIFITNRDDLVYESIQYRPFRFIRKSRIKDELQEAIIAIAHKIKSENQYYTLSFNNSEIQIKISDIIYVESYRHDIYLYSKDEKYRIKSNLTRLEKEFEVFGFIRVHSGYLVNYRFIYSIERTKIILKNKTMVPLSRHRAEAVKQKLQLYARGTDR